MTADKIMNRLTVEGKKNKIKTKWWRFSRFFHLLIIYFKLPEAIDSVKHLSTSVPFHESAIVTESVEKCKSYSVYLEMKLYTSPSRLLQHADTHSFYYKHIFFFQRLTVSAFLECGCRLHEFMFHSGFFLLLFFFFLFVVIYSLIV